MTEMGKGRSKREVSNTAEMSTFISALNPNPDL